MSATSSRGETLLAPDTLSVTRRVDAEIDLLPSAKPLKHGARVRVHNGTAEVLGRVSIAGAVRRRQIAPGGGRRSVAPAARSAGGADARRSLHHPRLLAADDDRRRHRARPGADAAGHSHRGGRARALERLRITADGVAAVQALIDDARTGRHRARHRWCRARAWRRASWRRRSEALGARQGGRRAGDRLVGAAHLDAASGELDRAGGGVAQGEPDERRPAARRGARTVFAKVAPAIFERVVDELKAGRALAGRRAPGAADAQGERGGRRRSDPHGDHRCVSRRRPEAAGCARPSRRR